MKNKLLNVLSGIAIASTVTVPFACCSCVNDSDIEVKMAFDAPSGVSIKEANVKANKDSTIVLNLPKNKKISSARIQMDNINLSSGSDFWCEGNIIHVVGTKLTGKKVIVCVELKDTRVTKLNISGLASVYSIGKSIDWSKVTVEAVYVDGKTETLGVNDYTVDIGKDYVFKASDVGQKEITVSYSGYSEKITVNVTDEEIIELLTSSSCTYGMTISQRDDISFVKNKKYSFAIDLSKFKNMIPLPSYARSFGIFMPLQATTGFPEFTEKLNTYINNLVVKVDGTTIDNNKITWQESSGPYKYKFIIDPSIVNTFTWTTKISYSFTLTNDIDAKYTKFGVYAFQQM